MTETKVTYVKPNRTDAGAVPVNTQVATHPRASDGANIQDVHLDNPIHFDNSYLTAFGVLQTAGRTPVIQGDFVYGINTQIWKTPVVSGTGAAVDTNEGRLRIQSGTGASNYAYIESRKPIRYRAGQGIDFLITPLFSAGVANNFQYWGVGAVVSNAIYDGYGWAMNGTEFGVAHYDRGVLAFTAQADWNGDKANGGADSTFTYDPTKGTPTIIKYPYLGFGDITFYIQHPTTAQWVLCHTIRYANSTNMTQLSNPSLFGLGFTVNTGNTTNRTMYAGSYGGFISGERAFVGNPKWAADSIKVGVTTEANIISLRNATTYNTILNRGMIRLNQISVSSTKLENTVIFRFKINPTVGGTPAFTTVNGTTANNGVTITSGNSIASYDVAGTTITGGDYIFNITLGSGGNEIVDLTPQNIFVAAGETLTVSAVSTGASTIGVSLNWSEDI